jgi:tetratricopeptide (TPR) repeat protein
MKRIGALAVALLLAACGQSARDALDQARKELSETRYSEAIAAADAGLARKPDPITSWGLEIVKAEALARAGKGPETVAQLEKLAAGWPDNLGAAQYAASADQLRGAGQGAVAIEVLDLGLKRFPDDPNLRAQIEQAKQASGPDSEEMERLRSLGYLK